MSHLFNNFPLMNFRVKKAFNWKNIELIQIIMYRHLLNLA